MYSYKIVFLCSSITGCTFGCLCRAAWDLWDGLVVRYTSFSTSVVQAVVTSMVSALMGLRAARDLAFLRLREFT